MRKWSDSIHPILVVGRATRMTSFMWDMPSIWEWVESSLLLPFGGFCWIFSPQGLLWEQPRGLRKVYILCSYPQVLTPKIPSLGIFPSSQFHPHSISARPFWFWVFCFDFIRFKKRIEPNKRILGFTSIWHVILKNKINMYVSKWTYVDYWMVKIISAFIWNGI